jgi:DNA-3-methyladenine glycosylase I
MDKKRCKWCNLNNPLYVEYHDNEWGKLRTDDGYLYEMLILESFQAGLSWECVLNKREAFRCAFDGFDVERVCSYDEQKVAELLNNKAIIRNKLKINAAINNSKIFKKIVDEYGSFYGYLKTFAGEEILYETDKTTNELSDEISADLQKRGMKFVGSTIIYSYLQAIGLIYSHEKDCPLFEKSGAKTLQHGFAEAVKNRL